MIISGLKDSLLIFRNSRLFIKDNYIKDLYLQLLLLNLIYISSYFIIESNIQSNLLWYYPNFLIIYFLNNKYFKKISTYYFLNILNLKSRPSEYNNLCNELAFRIHYNLTTLLIYIIISCFTYIGLIGRFIFYLLMCFYNSILCFEFALDKLQVMFQQRMVIIEKKWSYLVGYGLLYGIISFLIHPIISYNIISLIMPIMIIDCYNNKILYDKSQSVINIPFYKLCGLLTDTKISIAKKFLT